MVLICFSYANRLEVVVSKISFSKRSVVIFILMLETSGILLEEQENKKAQRVNKAMDILIDKMLLKF